MSDLDLIRKTFMILAENSTLLRSVFEVSLRKFYLFVKVLFICESSIYLWKFYVFVKVLFIYFVSLLLLKDSWDLNGFDQKSNIIYFPENINKFIACPISCGGLYKIAPVNIL